MNRNYRDWSNDVIRQRDMSRNNSYGNYYPYPAMDDHYRMYRDWNDRSHYAHEDYSARPDDSGRTGYMRYSDDRDRILVSSYGYRTVGDRSNYGHSGTGDFYDPRRYDRERNMYGIGAGSYPNGPRDERIRYDSDHDWNTRGKDAGNIAYRHFDSVTDHNYDRDHNLYRRNEGYNDRYRNPRDPRTHFDAEMNKRNTSAWMGDMHQERTNDRMDRDHYADRSTEARNSMRERDRSEQRERW